MSEPCKLPKPPPPKKPSGAITQSDFRASSSHERATGDGPFSWQNKAAMEKIRTYCEDAKSSLAVYVALCEVASDERKNCFRVSMDKVASKCCLSPRTVFDRLNDLEEVGVIEIQRSRTSENLRIPSTYTLLAVKSHFKQ